MKKIVRLRAFLRTSIVICLLGLTAGWVNAQTLRGTIMDDQGIALEGATILIKGTQAGVIAGANGAYSIELPEGADSLSVSFLGFLRQVIAIQGRTEINISLMPEDKLMDEVVITALGIERDKKALGYAITEIDGSELLKARETNVVNSLAGKVAGVQVTNSASGVGGSARITIRGESSLNINKNQPLFVVDGVPISNDVFGSSGSGNMTVDYGNAAGEINPDDIESISVLKGPNASALYGSRAANGVILIKTKSGKGTRGIGVDINSSATFESVLLLPDWQDQYGQGNNGLFEFVDGNGSGIADGVDESWGPAFNGQLIPQFDSPTNKDGIRGGDIRSLPYTITPTPWVARAGNIDEFYETGVTLTNNFAISGANDKGDFRLSYTNLDQEGLVPNTNLKRNTFNLVSSYKITDKASIRANVNYVNQESDNRVSIGYGTESLMYLWIWYGRQLNTLNLRDYWQPGYEGVQQYNYNYNYHDNPYFTVYENTNAQTKNRLFGNLQFNYDFTPELKLQVRSGIDYFNDLRPRIRAYSTQRFPKGQYREDNIEFEEMNTDFLLSYNKQVNTDWFVSVSAGGNRMEQTQKYLELIAPQLSIPGIYNFGNSAVDLTVSQFNQEKRINSLYGLGQVAYRNMIFVDVTGRNDWSSTLPDGNNSYFYPSASMSFVLSDILKVPTSSALSYAKLRLGWAQVGNDTDPYNLRNTFAYGTPWGSNQSVSESNTLRNENLKPESVATFELGADVRLFKNRIGLDVTYFDIRSRDQIINVPIDRTSGYDFRVINAGEIRNYGVEALLSVVPVKLKSGFQWDVNFNFTANRSEVVELAEGINQVVLTSQHDAFITAAVGERMGAIYGRGFQRVADGPYAGQIIYASNGTPERTPGPVLQGNYNPDWMLGIQNNLSYKGFNLSFLFDIRQGGTVVSRTKTIGSTSGQLEETLYGRENGYDLSVAGNGIIGEGVIDNGDGTYRPNDVQVSSRVWHNTYYRRDNVEAAKYDASYVKLRELRLDYRLPASLMNRTPFRGASIAVVGRNLFLWTENPHFDPETMAMGGGTLRPGIESMAYPSARSIGVNLRLSL